MQLIKRAIGGILALSCAFAATAQTTLTPEQARRSAAKLLVSGHPRAAADITSVLIKRDAEDAPALILHAHAMRTLRQYPDAQTAARQAWLNADRPVERYGSAIAMAQALSSDGKKTRAQFWLRRASHVAPTPQMQARAARDYQYLRKTNPWSFQFSFGITPSDNVNNAPRDNTIVLGGLVFSDPTAIPIAGFEVNTDATLRYTFNSSQTNRNFVALRWAEGHVVFTDDDVPEGVDADAYAYRRIEGQFGWDFVYGPDKPRQNVTLTLGRLWSGGDVLADEARINWSQVYNRPEGRQFSWNTSVGYSDRKDNAIRSGVTASLGASWSRLLGNGGRLGWHTGLTRTDTDSAIYTHSRLDFGVHYSLPKPILGARAQLSATTQLRAYDDPIYGLEARHDESLTISGSLLFVNFDTYGFAPKLTLEASETKSNITRFETRNFGLKIGFQSVF